MYLKISYELLQVNDVIDLISRESLIEKIYKVRRPPPLNLSGSYWYRYSEYYIPLVNLNDVEETMVVTKFLKWSDMVSISNDTIKNYHYVCRLHWKEVSLYGGNKVDKIVYNQVDFIDKAL